MVETSGMGYLHKNLDFGKEGRDRLISGVLKMSRAVKSTLGPNGNTVLIESPHYVQGIKVTKDGVTVAKSIDLADPVENLAVRIMKEAAGKTSTSAGDGPQPLYSRVLTPRGFVELGQIKPKDIICGTNGTNQVVIDVFPKGELSIYEVELDGGRISRCSSNHLWEVTNGDGVCGVLSTDEIMREIDQIDYYINTNSIMEFDSSININLPLDPFFVGLLLSGAYIGKVANTLCLNLMAKEMYILDNIILPETVEIISEFCEVSNLFKITFQGHFNMSVFLSKIGISGNNRYIPEAYMYSSFENRESLLKGLTFLDRDTFSNGLFEFATSSDVLADNFKELIMTLGIPYKTAIEESISDDIVTGGYKVYYIMELPSHKYGSKILRISEIDKKTEMACLKVSNSDHLYITDGYMPTHNTTTAIVLTEALVLGGAELIKEGMSRTDVLRNISDISTKITNNLKAKAKAVSGSMLLDIASISANNDPDIGKIISEVYKEVGETGIVTVEKSQTSNTYSEITRGLVINRGYISPLFVNNEKRDECIFEDAMVLVVDMEISSVLQLEGILKPIIAKSENLVIISPCSEAVINTLVTNKIRGNLKVAVVPPPNFGYKQHDLMQDIAISVGATYYSQKTGDDLSLLNYTDLGHASKIIINRDKTIIIRSTVKSKDTVIQERVTQLWASHSEATNNTDKYFIEERIASLTGGIGIIFVGGQTDLEQEELYDRVDDAVCAVKSAIEEGVLPGAGKALQEEGDLLVYESSSSNEYKAAINIMKLALMAPFLQILANGELDYKKIYKEDTPIGHGYNLKNGVMGDLIEMGVVDPMKVTRCALQNAVSVATTILSTNAIVTLARVNDNKII